MFVLLTSKPGLFRTEPTPGLTPVEAWDYLFADVLRARFVIAELAMETRIRVVDEAPPPVFGLFPTKFLPRFETIEAARHELLHLTRNGRGSLAALRRTPLPA
jgi:hypothetical protein